MNPITLTAPVALKSNEKNREGALRLANALLRIIIGCTFCVSGLLKFVNHYEFVEAMTSYGLFSKTQIAALALAVPHVEILLGISFAIGMKTRFVGSVLAVQLIVFSIITAAALSEGRAVECGCFPVEGAKEQIGSSYFIRNGVLTLFCIWTVFTYRESPYVYRKR